MTKNFTIKTTDKEARRGVLKTRHGEIQTPVFMPPATTAEQLYKGNIRRRSGCSWFTNNFGKYLPPFSAPR